jgi:AcrR family transcriptional regulator
MSPPKKRREAFEPIFPRLPGGGALSPERVAAHQRARLEGAMVEAVRRSGYAQMTIRELVALAGVSKSAFYRHFDSKQDCFLATFDEISAEGARRVEEAYRHGEGLRGSLLAGLGAFAETVAEEPAAASLALVDSLHLGGAGVAHREAAAARFEVLVLRSFAAAGTPLTALEARAIVGGWSRVAYRALRDGEPGRLAAGVDDLVSWALSYRSAAEIKVPSPRPRPAGDDGDGTEELGWSEPPDGPAARRALDRRGRILRAVAQLAAEEGHEAVTIPAVSARARTSNEAWYESFSSKDEALGAAFDQLGARALAVSVAAFEAERDWERGVAAGLAALLRHIAEEPVFARLAFFEMPASGLDGLERSDVAVDAFTAYLRPGAFGADRPELPAITRDAIAGGVWAAVQHELARGRAARLPALAPRFAALALAPFRG